MKAFPRQITFNNGIVKGEWIDDGMDLRDYFAAKALSGLLSEDKCYYNAVARQAYRYADAMMKAREQ
jgi:hypothetical protein